MVELSGSGEENKLNVYNVEATDVIDTTRLLTYLLTYLLTVVARTRTAGGQRCCNHSSIQKSNYSTCWYFIVTSVSPPRYYLHTDLYAADEMTSIEYDSCKMIC